MGINQQLFQKFKRVLSLPDLDWLESTAISRHYYEGAQGIGPRQSFISPPDELLKRMMDIILSILLGILCLPVVLLTALLIKLDSPGPVFYKQARVGKDGRRIDIWKFRSMQLDADKILAEHLAENPGVRLEWDETQKLREVSTHHAWWETGAQFSIDELPQLDKYFRQAI